MKQFIAAALFAFPLAACASGPDGPSPEAISASFSDEAARILAHARAVRQADGCEAAAPAYRVVAAMGGGYEAAQHELGECLLSIAGADAREAELIRDEGLFWLKRAAHAGNARAQRALATTYGSAASPREDKAEALKWALVYAANAEADLYGYKALPATFAPGLVSDLDPAAVAEAEAFADNFSRLSLPEFTPPARAGRDEGPRRLPRPDVGRETEGRRMPGD